MIYSKQCFSAAIKEKDAEQMEPKIFLLKGQTPADILEQSVRYQAFNFANLLGDGNGPDMETYRQIIKDLLSRDFEPPEI